jgi:LPXTG-motif cell wall-anchored protein
VLTLNTPGAPVVQAATTVRAADTGRSLPRTGVQVLFLSLVALAVIGLGTVLVRMRRTR